jgi:hypothetical protein
MGSPFTVHGSQFTVRHGHGQWGLRWFVRKAVLHEGFSRIGGLADNGKALTANGEPLSVNGEPPPPYRQIRENSDCFRVASHFLRTRIVV